MISPVLDFMFLSCFIFALYERKNETQIQCCRRLKGLCPAHKV